MASRRAHTPQDKTGDIKSAEEIGVVKLDLAELADELEHAEKHLLQGARMNAMLEVRNGARFTKALDGPVDEPLPSSPPPPFAPARRLPIVPAAGRDAQARWRLQGRSVRRRF